MSQGIIAGATSYENQSLNDIIKDIKVWISYSEELCEEVNCKINELKCSEFYSKIPYNYWAVIVSIPKICRTNIEDLTQVLSAIDTHTLSEKKVDLFYKVGKNSFKNSEENRKCYRCNDERWHDYDNADFRKVETIYADFGDYCATLWDVTNAASRLKDYIDIPKEVATVKFEDNSVHIGNSNQISNSVIGSKNMTKVKQETKKEPFLPKYFWEIFVAILATVVGTAICVWLGLS